MVGGHVSPTIDEGVTNLSGGTFDLAGAGRSAGRHAADGDGSRTAFRIPHGLGTTPAETRVRPRSPAAAAAFYHRDPDESAIVIEYASPPDSGDGNLEWEFAASV